MTRELLNTLFVTTPGAYVRLDGETLKVEIDGQPAAQIPVHHLGSVVLFGPSSISPGAMSRCSQDGRSVTFLDYGGRFQYRLVGPTQGNVLLRKAQYDAHVDPARSAAIARSVVAGKIQNGRRNLLRAARDSRAAEAGARLRAAADQLGTILIALPHSQSVDALRGQEGEAAALYFGVFGDMISASPAEFGFRLRTRRPPRDRVNALLSFVYALLTADCVTALEGIGLDPQIGYLHALRPGRPGLALDLVEELRPAFADRLVLNLVNRRQVRAEQFEERAGGSVLMAAEARKAVLTAYQRRKQEEVAHPLLKENVPWGLIAHLQARLLARHLRGDLGAYPPFLSP